MSVFDLPPVEVTEVVTSGGGESSGGGYAEAPHTETVVTGVDEYGYTHVAEVIVGGN